MPTGSPEGTSCHPTPPAAPFPSSRLPTAALWYGSAIREGRKEGICRELLTSLGTTHLQLPLEALLCRPDREKRHATASPHNAHSLLPSVSFAAHPSEPEAEDYQSPVSPPANREELEVPPCHREPERSTLIQDALSLRGSHRRVGETSVQSEGSHGHLAAASCSPGKTEQTRKSHLRAAVLAKPELSDPPC